MNREEAIYFANCLKNNYTVDLNDMEAFCDMAIKALAQEPTTKNNLGVDCVSRGQVLGLKIHAPIAPVLYSDNSVHYEDIILVRDVEKLPSVTPQEPRKGHWVHGEYCSECGCDVPAYIIDWKWKKDMNAKYCPNCGADMR